MTRKNKRLKRRLTRTENALVSAICIIRNEAGTKLHHRQQNLYDTLNRWADELIAESGIDFYSVLTRTTRD